MNTSINKKLDNLNREDLIWIVSFFLVLASAISNQFEKKAILENNHQSHKTSQEIKIVILIVALFVYLFFVLNHYQNIENLKHNLDNNQTLLDEQARLIASLLFLIGGIIFLETELNNFQDNRNQFI